MEKIKINRWRFFVCGLLCIVNAICCADRTNIGIVIPYFVREKKDRGLVLASFFYGYLMTQIPAGFLASKIGVKSVLLLGVIVWTIFDTATIFASHSIPLLVSVRVLMGAGEGALTPSLHRFAMNWFPLPERSTLVAVMSSGADLGTILSLVLSPLILKYTGNWISVFLVYAAFSLVWIVSFALYVSSKPEQHPLISTEERDYIISYRTGALFNKRESMPWRTLLCSRPLWSIYLTQFCFNYAWYILLGWLPQYFQEKLHLDLSTNSLLLAIPYICGYVGLLFWGYWSDRLLAAGYRTLYVRRLMNTISSIVPAVCLYLLRYASDPIHATLCLSCTLFAGRACISGFWVNMLDVGPENAGNTMAISNTIGTLPGIFGNLITGLVLQHTENWDLVFTISSGLVACGGIIFLCFSTDRNVFPNQIIRRNFKMWRVEKRYVLAFLLCVANTICYADRTNIGIAIPSFVAEKKDRGIVLSSFFYGYILTQLPAGWWASRVGVKMVLAIGVILWTICDTSTVLVSHSIPLLILVRAGMGCGEGVIMPSLHRFAANWFPISERSTLVAVISSGSDLGTISALLLSPWIMKISHWTMIFLVFGTFSLIWLICFVNFASSKPEHHPSISNREKEYIISTRRTENTSRDSQPAIPWRVLLSSKPLWSIYTAHFCFNYGWYVLLSWLPQYLQEELGLDLTKNEFLAATPYIFGFIGLIMGGHVSDRLIAAGYRTLYVRRFMNCISSFIPALFLILLRYVQHPWQAILCLSCALFTGRASTSGYWINMIDVGPEYAGKTMGMSNTIATIPGILGNLITGYILQRTQSWDMVFTVAAVITTIGGIVFLCFSTDRNVFLKKSNSDEALPFLKTIETI